MTGPWTFQRPRSASRPAARSGRPAPLPLPGWGHPRLRRLPAGLRRCGYAGRKTLEASTVDADGIVVSRRLAEAVDAARRSPWCSRAAPERR